MAWSSTPSTRPYMKSTLSQHVAHDDQRPSTRTLAEAFQRLRDARRRIFGVLAQDRIGPPVFEIKIKRSVADLPEDRRPLGLHRAVVQTAVRDELDVATGVFQEYLRGLHRPRRFRRQRRRQERPQRQSIRLRCGDRLPPPLLSQCSVKVDFVRFGVAVSQVREPNVRRFHCVGQCRRSLSLEASPPIEQRAALRTSWEQCGTALESE